MWNAGLVLLWLIQNTFSLTTGAAVEWRPIVLPIVLLSWTRKINKQVICYIKLRGSYYMIPSVSV